MFRCIPFKLLSDVDRKNLGEELVVLCTRSLSFDEQYEHENNIFLSISQVLNNLFTL
jgi:hypothetical protein